MAVIHHLDGGTLRPLGGAELNGADELVCHVLVVEGDAGLVLVDAGIGLADGADPEGRLGAEFCELTRPLLDPERTVVRQLERLGLDPARVGDVIVTHPDRDHVGGLADLPWARVHAHPDAVAAARHPTTPRDRDRVQPRQWDHTVRWAPPLAPRAAWFGLEAWAADGLGDDIVVVSLPGHATGHVGVAVATGGGWLLHAGDAYFHRGARCAAEGPVPAGVAAFEEAVEADGEARRATVARLAALPPEVTVVCSHDPVELRRLRGAEPGPPASAQE